MDIKFTTQGAAPARLVTCFNEQLPISGDLDAKLTKIIEDMVDNEIFSPKFGNVQVITLGHQENPRHIILIGLGKEEEMTVERVRRVAGKAVKQAQKLKATELDIDISGFGNGKDNPRTSMAIAEGAMLATYKFDKFKSDRKENPIKNVNIVGGNRPKDLEEGLILAEATNLTRHLVD